MSYYKKSISADDPQVLEKLTEKLEQCQALQDVMKDVNAHWRKTGTCQGAPGVTDAQAAKLDAKVQNTAVSWERVPFSDYELKNNNAEIRRLKSRIEEVAHNREVGFSGWDFHGGHVEANAELNRLQLFFYAVPTQKYRTVLKANGFKWSPTHGAWQRQLNDNAIYAAGQIDFIKPSDGRTVREHQPKAPDRGDGSR